MLADGVITQTERELLLKRGQKLGYTPEEIDTLIQRTQKRYKDSHPDISKISIKGDQNRLAEKEQIKIAEDAFVIAEKSYYGLKVTQIFRQTVASYMIAADNGNSRSAHTLGLMFLLGNCVEKNVKLGFE